MAPDLDNFVFSSLIFILNSRPNYPYFNNFKNASWSLNRGKNNNRTPIGTAKRWERPLNRGDRLQEFYLHYYTNNSFATLITDLSIEGGR